jgi:hypothetical protein
LRGHPHEQVREKNPNPIGWMLGSCPLLGFAKKKKRKKDESKKKYQERKFGVSGVLVMIVCGNPVSVLSSLNTH